jgi:hypothetical protein
MISKILMKLTTGGSNDGRVGDVIEEEEIVFDDLLLS